jgi:hypothetical protein
MSDGLLIFPICVSPSKHNVSRKHIIGENESQFRVLESNKIIFLMPKTFV